MLLGEGFELEELRFRLERRERVAHRVTHGLRTFAGQVHSPNPRQLACFRTRLGASRRRELHRGDRAFLLRRAEQRVRVDPGQEASDERTHL